MAEVISSPKDVWCVWSKYGRRPSRFHPTREIAETEAARLAQKLPGKSFIVMHMVSKFSTEKPIAMADAREAPL